MKLAHESGELKPIELSDNEKSELNEILQSPPHRHILSAADDEKIARIYSLGPAAALYIIAGIKDTDDKEKIFTLANALEYADTTSVECEIGSLLLRENIANDNDRSTKSRILDILNRVGIPANIPQLKKYGEMSFDTKYRGGQGSRFNRDDVTDAIQAILYIKSALQEGDDENLALANSTIEYLNTSLTTHGYRSLLPGELRNLELLSKRSNFDIAEEGIGMTYIGLEGDYFDDAENISELDDPFGIDMWDDPDMYAEEDEESSFDSVEEETGSEGGKSEYNFFTNSIERNELFEYSKKIAEYLHDEKIPNLVIIDRSSRPLYIGVKAYWRYKYPEQKAPNIYFMNPSGFKTEDSGTNPFHHGNEKPRSEQVVIDDFQQVYKRLMEDKDKPVLVFDSCIHSGNTLWPIEQAMRKSGFGNIIIGSINPSDRGSSVQTDFYITKERPEKGCYPFDRDRMIEKVLYSTHSRRTLDEERILDGVKLRREIKRIMEEKIQELSDESV